MPLFSPCLHPPPFIFSRRLCIALSSGFSVDPRIVPSTSSWLTPEEQQFIQNRLPPSSPRSSEKDFDLKEFVNTLKDKRIWLFLVLGHIQRGNHRPKLLPTYCHCQSWIHVSRPTCTSFESWRFKSCPERSSLSHSF